jgi:hypothetical protein
MSDASFLCGLGLPAPQRSAYERTEKLPGARHDRPESLTIANFEAALPRRHAVRISALAFQS